MHTSRTEQEKYEIIWEVAGKDYGKNSPGERYMEQAYKALKMFPGDKLIDFGCGCGRPAHWFFNRGLKVTGIDIAKNCLEVSYPWKFINTHLWDHSLPELLESKPDQFTYGFCTDVLEHIPEEFLDRVLSNIATTTDAAFLSIHTEPDLFSNWIKKNKHKDLGPLHLTLMDDKAWRKKLSQFWGNLETVRTGTVFTVICREPHDPVEEEEDVEEGQES